MCTINNQSCCRYVKASMQVACCIRPKARLTVVAETNRSAHCNLLTQHSMDTWRYRTSEMHFCLLDKEVHLAQNAHLFLPATVFLLG